MDEEPEVRYFSIMSIDLEKRDESSLSSPISNLDNGLRSTSRDRIPVFSLYGETDERLGEEFLHLEEIVTRSQQYGWEIDGHVHHGLCQILVVEGGGVDLRLDEVETSPPAPCAVVVPPSTVHAFRFRPGTKGWVLTFSESRFTQGDAERRALVEMLFARAAVVDFAGATGSEAAEAEIASPAPRRGAEGSSHSVGAECERLSTLLGLLAAEFFGRASGRGTMLGWFTAATLMEIARRRAASLAAAAAGRPEAALFARFRALIEGHFLEHRPIGWYAAALGVTESRLDRAARAVTGHSPFAAVQDRLILEARRKLVYIAAPVSKIAYELGYDDPSYFWRVFRRRTGMTPTAFRAAERARGANEG